MSQSCQPIDEAPCNEATLPKFPGIKTGDFRDRLATAEKDGRRKWVYPKKVNGKWYRYRTCVSWFLLGIMFSGPFIKINDNPLLLLNILERKFIILGQIFWPQDFAILAIAMLVFITGIIIFTTAFGRLWCGWACPQTILMEMVFRKIEYLIEGDASAQKALAKASWNYNKLLKKLAKHSVFFLLSLLVGNCLLSYIIGIDQLRVIVTDNPRNHMTGLAFMLLFSTVFYLIFARFREQACTFICPYGRLQSAMIDENTMVVAYDHKRGEKRSRLSRNQPVQNRLAQGFGDCVNCFQCVAVCPTGIDIRNGTQMECVNCTACIDACDGVMTKVGRPLGLIRYASLNSIEHGKRFRFTGRMMTYTAVLTALTLLFSVLLFTRSEVQSMFLRAPGALFQELPNGKISNLYTLKIVNKTSRDIPIQLRLDNISGDIQLMGNGQFFVPKQNLTQTSVLVSLDAPNIHASKTKLTVGVYSDGKRLETIRTVFIGPRT